MFETLALVLLLLAFAVLLWTFFWVARLLAHRAEEKQRLAKTAAAKKNKIATQAEEKEEKKQEEKEQEEPAKKVHGRGYGANYGILLGALSCGLFWLSPLIVALSFVGGFYSVRALANGVLHFRIVVWRAVGGLLLNIGGIALQFMAMLDFMPSLA
jgi:Flp pilus assembly protein TadB